MHLNTSHNYTLLNDNFHIDRDIFYIEKSVLIPITVITDSEISTALKIEQRVQGSKKYLQTMPY